jgi:putative heme-binding domain-containing protein
MSPFEAAALLGDERPAVRRRAASVLAESGMNAVPALAEAIRNAPTAVARREAVWSATRIMHPDARAAVRVALSDADPDVRQAALHSAGAWRDRGALPALLSLLRSDSAHNRRAAAEAVGRIGERRAVPALLKALEIAADRMLEHSLTFALIEIADRRATLEGLSNASPHARRAALTALDQMKGGDVPVEAVTSALASADPLLRETAWWIAGRHAQWDQALVEPLDKLVRTISSNAADQDELVRRLARLAARPAIGNWLGERLLDPSIPDETRRTILRAIAQASVKDPPRAWIAALARMLARPGSKPLGEALAAIRALPVPRQANQELVAALLGIAVNPAVGCSTRLQALAAIPGGIGPIEPGTLDFLLDHLRAERPVADRAVATEVLLKAQLRSEQLAAVAGALVHVSPLELGRLLGVFSQSSDEQVGRRLVDALKVAPARSSLTVEALEPQLARFGPSARENARPLLAALEAGRSNQRARLERVLSSIKGKPASERRGHELFHSQKLGCSACHKIAYVGGTVGPALTQIGRLRSEQDLLESIVYPSATLVQGYESVAVATREGQVLSGVIVNNAPERIVLATGANQEVRLDRDQIEELKPSPVSVMPDGLAEQLTAQELADLLEFLKTCK